MRQLRKIVHVEDDPDIQEVSKMALELVGGYTLFQFFSGQEAIEKSSEIEPDLFLLDVMMPGLSGEETLAGLRQIETTKCIPAIFMTAKTRASDQAALRALGALDVIAKPFDPLELPSQIQALWDRSQHCV